jgi:hypothetical protein
MVPSTCKNLRLQWTHSVAFGVSSPRATAKANKLDIPTTVNLSIPCGRASEAVHMMAEDRAKAGRPSPPPQKTQKKKFHDVFLTLLHVFLNSCNYGRKLERRPIPCLFVEMQISTQQRIGHGSLAICIRLAGFFSACKRP